MPKKLAWFQEKIDQNKHNLFYYFLFLRLTPVVPNWFLNASSAIVGVPFSIFFIATLIGLVPYSAILINMGLALDKITTIGHDWNVSTNNIFEANHVYLLQSMLTLFCLAFVALIPTYLTKKEDRMDSVKE